VHSGPKMYCLDNFLLYAPNIAGPLLQIITKKKILNETPKFFDKTGKDKK
jgi:hypothetical protein